MTESTPLPGDRPRRLETEPPGTTYDRYSVARLHWRLVRRYGWKSAVEVPAGGAKACPSLYSLPLALARCRVTLVNPLPSSLSHWRRLELSDRVTTVRAQIHALPFSDHAFDLAWNYVTLGREGSMLPALSEMTRVAGAVLLIGQNGYNLGYPWHHLLHWIFKIPWDHGQTRYFFPANVVSEMREAGLTDIEVGLLDQAPWPDPPGFRDIRLHRAGTKPHPEDEVDWRVPAVDYFQKDAFPTWMRLCAAFEELPLPRLLRWPVNHMYYVLAFAGGKSPRAR